MFDCWKFNDSCTNWDVCSPNIFRHFNCTGVWTPTYARSVFELIKDRILFIVLNREKHSKGEVVQNSQYEWDDKLIIMIGPTAWKWFLIWSLLNSMLYALLYRAVTSFQASGLNHESDSFPFWAWVISVILKNWVLASLQWGATKSFSAFGSCGWVILPMMLSDMKVVISSETGLGSVGVKLCWNKWVIGLKDGGGPHKEYKMRIKALTEGGRTEEVSKN